ncbi:ubiquinone/menaquinone biosynthesis methyltransferase ubiE [Phakopsora pachyrhizi]|uniref:2-methoxy-6-polyprenyl-1,4-benzoquinol methylase, mitochondrial n=1 Tax=Phakopsora pachyrhizi TaxID=170000 RepID=A0AAV0BCK9_PHAPC|nr:ubiquinone/menaquinone biosynthesis methyltransferase ubiE [Phakopsora pachyrhizi]
MNRSVIRSIDRARPIRRPTGLENYSPTQRKRHQDLNHRFVSSQPNQQQPQPGDGTDRLTHFGFRDVPENLKQKLVGNVFSSVASSYDLMNDAMSLGIHRLWKDQFIKSIDPNGSLNCLDVAGGTADIALRILDNSRLMHSNRDTKVLVVDINPKMLEEGQKKVRRTVYHTNREEDRQIDFRVGDAEDLRNVEDGSVDLYTISFGIRNCTNIDKVLREAYRVLKKGGRFSCLEFGKVQNPILSRLYEAYSFNVIPNLGHIIASDRDSYQYLVESIQKFPSQPEFARMIEEAGFILPRPSRENGMKRWADLSFGLASIHDGVKL